MPHPTDVHVGHRLREVRIMRGLTQTQLGERLGISFQQVPLKNMRREPIVLAPAAFGTCVAFLMYP